VKPFVDDCQLIFQGIGNGFPLGEIKRLTMFPPEIQKFTDQQIARMITVAMSADSVSNRQKPDGFVMGKVISVAIFVTISVESGMSYGGDSAGRAGWWNQTLIIFCILPHNTEFLRFFSRDNCRLICFLIHDTVLLADRLLLKLYLL
jgi:hypothetical protein